MKTDNEILIGGYRKVAPSDIVMLKADTNYTIAYLSDGSNFMSATTLGILEERLKQFNFYRTHRSTLVNMEYISKNSLDAINYNLELNLKSVLNIPVARRKINDFIKTFQIYNSL